MFDHTINPRYRAYCNKNRMSPVAQLDADRAKYPGGCMVGYMEFIKIELEAAVAEHPEWFFIGEHITGLINQEAFTQYLLGKYPDEVAA